MNDDPYKNIEKSIGVKPIRMSALALKLGLVKEGESVPSSVGAAIRVRLKRLIDAGKIVQDGERATTTYRKTPKVQEAAPQPKAPKRGRKSGKKAKK